MKPPAAGSRRPWPPHRPERRYLYVVSYHTSGFYSADYNFFANGPLTATASTPSAGNGLYIYGQTSSFPTTSSKSANYWVDLAFLSSSTQPALLQLWPRPSVIKVLPAPQLPTPLLHLGCQ